MRKLLLFIRSILSINAYPVSKKNRLIEMFVDSNRPIHGEFVQKRKIISRLYARGNVFTQLCLYPTIRTTNQKIKFKERILHQKAF
jgi:hypothetical protein